MRHPAIDRFLVELLSNPEMAFIVFCVLAALIYIWVKQGRKGELLPPIVLIVALCCAVIGAIAVGNTSAERQADRIAYAIATLDEQGIRINASEASQLLDGTQLQRDIDGNPVLITITQHRGQPGPFPVDRLHVIRFGD